MSKFVIPIKLLDINNITDDGFIQLYFRNSSLKKKRDVEEDLVLDRKLDNFQPVLPSAITSDDTVLTAFEKLQAIVNALQTSTVDWNDITNIPAMFTPSPHNHDWNDILNIPATFPPSAHNHDWSDIENQPIFVENVIILTTDWDNNEAIISVSHVTSDSLLTFFYDSDTLDMLINFNIRPVEQGTEFIKFTCENVPDENVIMIVKIENF